MNTEISYCAVDSQMNDAGPAIAQMLLKAIGHERSQKELSVILDTTKSGTKIGAIETLLQSSGFATAQKNHATLHDIMDGLVSGATVVIGYRSEDGTRDHYAIVKDLTDTEISLIDPFVGPDVSLSNGAFESRWHAQDSSDGDHVMMAAYFPDNVRDIA
ncbi:MAG TPA: cysteine peptidase family C39 domain-containing protein [Candidatus Paceibacterota bacterium]|nr:cysteine peptidase family C39 domain-containing protein [Candidatus Paceibacterota bacterium]